MESGTKVVAQETTVERHVSTRTGTSEPVDGSSSSAGGDATSDFLDAIDKDTKCGKEEGIDGCGVTEKLLAELDTNDERMDDESLWSIAQTSPSASVDKNTEEDSIPTRLTNGESDQKPHYLTRTGSGDLDSSPFSGDALKDVPRALDGARLHFVGGRELEKNLGHPAVPPLALGSVKDRRQADMLRMVSAPRIPPQPAAVKSVPVNPSAWLNQANEEKVAERERWNQKIDWLERDYVGDNLVRAAGFLPSRSDGPAPANDEGKAQTPRQGAHNTGHISHSNGFHGGYSRSNAYRHGESDIGYDKSAHAYRYGELERYAYNELSNAYRYGEELSNAYRYGESERPRYNEQSSAYRYGESDRPRYDEQSSAYRYGEPDRMRYDESAYRYGEPDRMRYDESAYRYAESEGVRYDKKRSARRYPQHDDPRYNEHYDEYGGGYHKKAEYGPEKTGYLDYEYDYGYDDYPTQSGGYRYSTPERVPSSEGWETENYDGWWDDYHRSGTRSNRYSSQRSGGPRWRRKDDVRSKRYW